MRLACIALTAVLSGGACSAQISDGGESQLGGTDTGGTGDPTGTPPVAKCTSRTVYLNFEGQQLTQGPSDATLNQASWMTISSGTAPPYLSGNANRATAIQSIVDGITAQLAQFPISVVATRPASGNYVMIVFGGKSTDVGSRFGGAVNQLDCGDARPNDVAWISDGVSPTERVVNFAVGAVGFGLGLTATTDPKDCMCGWDNQCTPNNGACRLTSPINRDPAANQTCAGSTAQDEVATFHKAFCE
jgi:hypothetical protein